MHLRDFMDVLPGMNAGVSIFATPSPIEGSRVAEEDVGRLGIESPARPTPIHPRRERRGFPAFFGDEKATCPGRNRLGYRLCNYFSEKL